MKSQPKRALLVEPEVIETARPRRRTAPRASIAVGAIVATAGLVAITLVPPMIDDAAPLAEPAPSTSAEDRSAGPSRANLRGALPSASPSASPTPSASTPAATPSSTPSATPTPSPSPKAEATQTPTPTPSPTPTAAPLPKLGERAGQRWATSGLNIRKGPGTNYAVVSSVASGGALTITDVRVDGWQQIILNGKAAYVSAKFLTDKEPSPEPTSSGSTTTESSSSDSATATAGSCTSASAKSAASGLTTRAKSVLNAVCAQFPSISSYGGYRNDSDSYHSQGRAIDVMISGDAGWEVANWARANASSLGITEVIYAQKIWTTQRSSEGWRSMADRGSVSANHYDHVHLSIK